MIYVTGARGYLGAHLLRLSGGVAVTRRNYEATRDRVVIHAGWSLPVTSPQGSSLDAVRRLIAARPAFVVFVSTRAEGGPYADAKREAERLLTAALPTHVVRLPGLFGPPRTTGLVYNLIAALQEGRAFSPDTALRDWRGMHVAEAAALCVHVARTLAVGRTVGANAQLDELLIWISSQS